MPHLRRESPIVLAYHCVLSMNGFWLPNDPRGSGSRFVASSALQPFGPARKVTTNRSVARVPHDRVAREEAKAALQHPPAVLTGKQAATVGEAFRQACRDAGYQIHALAILPDHVHLVLGRHTRPVRQVVGHLKAKATMLLHERGLWPAERPLWGEHGRNVYLDTAVRVKLAIRYVEENPLKAGKPRQRWS